MSEVRLLLKFEGSKKARTLNVLFSKQDSLSFIKEEVAAEIANLLQLRHSKKIILNGKALEATHAIVVDFYINDICLSDEFLVVKDLDTDVIINDATIRKWRIKVKEENNTVYVNPALAQLRV